MGRPHLSPDLVQDRREMVERVTLARRYKAETCGGEIAPELFGDTVDYAGGWTSHSMRDISDEKRRAYIKMKSEQGRKSSITQARANKEKSGGIIGVYEVRTLNDGRRKWQASKGDSISTHFCAIEAAIVRNRAMDNQKPGIKEFQCDIKAVWRRWGCACGNHKKGDLA